MRRLAACLACAGMLVMPVAAGAVPATPQAHPGRHHVARQVARRTCRTERSQLGLTAFRQKYGASKALAACVKAKLPSTRTAAAACRAERKRLGKAALRVKYPGTNALRVCVGQTTAG